MFSIEISACFKIPSINTHWISLLELCIPYKNPIYASVVVITAKSSIQIVRISKETLAVSRCVFLINTTFPSHFCLLVSQLNHFCVFPLPLGPVNKFTMANISFMYHIILNTFSTINLYLLYMKKCIRTTRNMTFIQKLEQMLNYFKNVRNKNTVIYPLDLF